MKQLLMLSLALSCSSAFAQATFTGPDLSGVYECEGKDAHEGDYSAIVTLTLNRAQSSGVNGAYHFQFEVLGFGAYPGHAVAHGKNMAIYFANTDPATKDFGTGIASFGKNKAGKWTFTKYYYEPEYKGGNVGSETCKQQ